MYKIRFFFIWMTTFLVHGLFAHSIALVHLGNNLPNHIYSTIAQARLFNENCPIFLITNEIAIQNAGNSLTDLQITLVTCESLNPSKAHIDFIKNPEQDWSTEGLWVYSSERFFFLEELIRTYNLSDVFHIESDVLLYADLENLLPVFKKQYHGMLGAVFENDRRCVPSILYIANLTPIKALVDFYPKTVHVLQADMNIIADFKDIYYRTFIDFLPITIPEYGEDYPLIGGSIQSKIAEVYSNNVDEFGALFDGAAFGIYLAGWNSRWHINTGPGTVSEWSVIDPSVFIFEWKLDPKGRRIPFVSYKNKQLPLINLHITNKSIIDQFVSIIAKK